MRRNMPIDDQAFADDLTAYAHQWPPERETVLLFEQLLDEPEDPFRRERLAGHFTASCWLVDASGERALLTHHKKLALWLQLGGHADGERDLQVAALKEAEEESGLHDLRIEPGIFDLDRHRIPEHKGVARALALRRALCRSRGGRRGVRGQRRIA